MKNLRHYFEVQHGLTFTDAEYKKMLEMAQRDIKENSVRETGASPILDWLLNIIRLRRKKSKVNLSKYSELEQKYS
jgi:hypothetical protein